MRDVVRKGGSAETRSNELRTGFADHTQNEAGTEQVQPRDQEVELNFA